MMHAESWEGVSEIRPGNYAFFDNFMATIGACRLEDCAATLLVSVVGHYPERNQMVIDGGALAFSKDAGAVHVEPDTNFGAVVGALELKLKSLSQELGIITSQLRIPYDRFRPEAACGWCRIIPALPQHSSPTSTWWRGTGGGSAGSQPGLVAHRRGLCRRVKALGEQRRRRKGPATRSRSCRTR